MIYVAPNKVIHTAVSEPDIRSILTKHRTTTIDGFVFDKATGELLGCYIFSEYAPESIDYPAPSRKEAANYVSDEDGTPIVLFTPAAKSGHIATVSTLPTTKARPHPKTKSTKGRKQPVVENPLYAVILAAKVEEKPTPWLDDYIHGAINTGPGVINGRYSVSPADVAKLLRLSEISVASASKCLLNYDHEPMSLRQLQRVVEAARVALRGIALHLERHPKILAMLDVDIDFTSFWTSNSTEKKNQGRKEHPQRQEVLRLLGQGEAVKTIARQTGVSKTTIKKWQLELLAACPLDSDCHGGGSVT
ncbi:helix-turn-helix domain-containing protein [Pseudomonas helleri]|uniref:helix-turn-helix domain-containing protein n=1 Tax=Pseudomonas helleri TaxID=1608996 RepID=UPI00065440FA|nr:helix-turn-helix domain-containing protein [Pseudomonas helleri]KMN09532.1 hypothetical protein TU84_09500 [Pseudomonas helleri]